MITPVTIYVPVPASTSERGVGAGKTQPVRAVDPAAKGRGGRHAEEEIRSSSQDQLAVAARRRARAARQQGVDDDRQPETLFRGDVKRPKAEGPALHESGDPESHKFGTSLTSLPQGPNRSIAINAFYRTIDSFGEDQAPRGTIFDFRI